MSYNIPLVGTHIFHLNHVHEHLNDYGLLSLHVNVRDLSCLSECDPCLDLLPLCFV